MLLTIIGIIVAIALAAYFWDYYKRKLREELVQSTVEANQGLPMQVNEDFVLSQVTATDLTLTYHYRLPNHRRDSIDQVAFKVNHQVSMLRELCSKERILKLLERGATIVHNFSDANGEAIMAIPLIYKHCTTRLPGK